MPTKYITASGQTAGSILEKYKNIAPIVTGKDMTEATSNKSRS